MDAYLVVEIDSDGYIRLANVERRIVHRETDSLLTEDFHYSLEEAKESLRGDDRAILAISEQGGGEAIWMYDSQREELTYRLKKWAGCYGSWPIYRLNGELHG